MTPGPDDVPPRLLVLTDRSQLRLGRSLVRTIEECVAAGATHVVVRELDETAACRAALVEAVVAAGGTAIAAHGWLPGASGVHLPAGGKGRGEVEREPAPGACSPAITPFGQSCHTREEVAAAARAGAAWVTLSPFADSASKPGRTPLTAAELAGHPVPAYALGGVTPANASDALAAGADGVAVMGAVMRAEDPALVVHRLLEALR